MNIESLSRPADGAKISRSLPWLAALIFFAALWLLDFPKPFVDDLAYTEAGVNLANGGDLSNPLLERQHFPSHYFFVYPPIQSYVLAGFLKMFGVSALSMTGFQMLMYLITAVATIAILRKHGAPRWLEWLVPLGVAPSFLMIGLRPEPLAAALIMAGFAMIECGCRRTAPLFVAFLLMFLGGATAPRQTLFSAALVLAAAWRLWSESPAPGWRRWSFCLPGLAAGVAVVFVFLMMIGFRLAEFWQTFHLHASLRVENSTRFYLLSVYFKHLGITLLPVFFLTGVSWGLTLWHPRDELFRPILFIICAFALTIFDRGVGPGTTWYVVLVLFFSITLLLRQGWRLRKMPPVVACSAMILANIKLLPDAIGVLNGKIQLDCGQQLSAALQMRSTAEQPVLVDDWVGRYVFGYKIPPGFLDFYFSAPFPGVGILDYYHPTDIYLVGPMHLEYLKSYTRLDFQPPAVWYPWGLERCLFYQHPRRVYVIPAAACKGLK